MGSNKAAIAGVGSCASSLVREIEYYRGRNAAAEAGLAHEEIGGWEPSDIEFLAAFDIDRRKVGRPLEEAVFASPSAYFMKGPARQLRDEAARRELERFIGADGHGGSDRADGADRSDGDGAPTGAGPRDRDGSRADAAKRPGEGT